GNSARAHGSRITNVLGSPQRGDGAHHARYRIPGAVDAWSRVPMAGARWVSCATHRSCHTSSNRGSSLRRRARRKAYRCLHTFVCAPRMLHLRSSLGMGTGSVVALFAVAALIAGSVWAFKHLFGAYADWSEETLQSSSVQDPPER